MHLNGADKHFALRLGMAGLLCTLIMAPAFAQALTPVQTTLQTLVTTLTGPIATSLAILAVISCGLLAFAGRLTWGVAGSVIFGIVLVFGATQIVSFFQTSAAG
ncbi:MAG: TrbC/VirB2 family protein [Hyphomicrobiales bacterium]|nr:TrbC/VirB2 family protein [Hyphomicrobiales bacterium]MDE2115811.1 TrbC/VirB2 family protein [Hyphomicrobiales bacterium]